MECVLPFKMPGNIGKLHFLGQLWLVLRVKLMEINSNFLWMNKNCTFGETTIFRIKILGNPIETTITHI